ncbi:MAG: MMPL family transporter [Myxococcota bacterium]
MRTLQAWIRNRSGRVLGIFFVLAVAAAGFATRIQIDGSVERLLLRSDPARALDAQAKVEFGNDEIIMVGLELGAPYTAEDLRRLAALSEELAELDHVRRVRDLSSTEDIRGVGDTLDASSLVDLETLERDFPAIRDRATGHPLYEDLLVSKDRKSLGILVYADVARSNDAALAQLTGAVIELVDRRAPPWKAHFAGYPVTAYEVNRIVKRDLALLTPLSLFAIGLVLLAVTRRPSSLVLLVVQIVWVELIALAWLGLSGTPINVIMSALPTFLVATSGTYVLYAIGLATRVADSEEPGVALVALLWRPALLSAASTGIGFASLRTIGMQSAGDLGLALAVGIAAAALGVLVLIPALIQYFRLRVAAPDLPRFRRFARGGVRLARRPAIAIGAAFVLLAACLPGLARLEVHTDTLQYFDADSRVRRGAQFFQDELASAFLLNVVIRGPEEGRALDPDFLAFVEDLRARIEHTPGVDRTISMLDYFGLMDAAMRPGEPGRANPGSRATAAQYLLLYESSGDPDDYERYLNFERSALSLIVSVHGGSTVYLEAARRIDEWARSAPPDVRVDTLGTTYLYSKAMDDLSHGMFRGLALASFLIFGVLAIGLGSFSLAGLAMVPNLLPLVVGAGVIGWWGIPISMSISLMGCIALGIAVDDTTHVASHLSRRDSLERLYDVVGPPILLTTVALCTGFSVLLWSDFAFVSVLGAAVLVSMLLALAADLWLLPSLLTWAGYVRTQGDRISRLRGPRKRETKERYEDIAPRW